MPSYCDHHGINITMLHQFNFPSPISPMKEAIIVMLILNYHHNNDWNKHARADAETALRDTDSRHRSS